MNTHKASVLLCSQGMRHPPLTSLIASACTCGPSNAPTLFSVTSSAAAHGPTSSKSKKNSLSVSGKFYTAKYYCIYLKILVSCLWFFKADFQKKKKILLFRYTPYKPVFRHINTTQKSVYLKPVGCWLAKICGIKMKSIKISKANLPVVILFHPSSLRCKSKVAERGTRTLTKALKFTLPPTISRKNKF